MSLPRKKSRSAWVEAMEDSASPLALLSLGRRPLVAVGEIVRDVIDLINRKRAPAMPSPKAVAPKEPRQGL